VTPNDDAIRKAFDALTACIDELIEARTVSPIAGIRLRDDVERLRRAFYNETKGDE